ncbi:MAG: mechanosensitive ion channel [Gammaproteobacteria bacterium]|nr:mechanosensitive ion channel [Gammaproteobacteria bacterium]
MEKAPIFGIITKEAIFNASYIELTLQLVVLLIAISFSLLVRKRWNRVIDLRIGDDIDPLSLRGITLRGTKRLSFSLTLSVLIFLIYGFFELFGHQSGLLYLVGQLVIILAAIRILVYLLQISAGPGIAKKAIDLPVSLVLWVFFAFYLLGWLSNTNEFFNNITITVGSIRISPLAIIEFLLISALLILVAMALSRFFEIYLSKTESFDSGVQLGLNKVIRYGLVGFSILFALSIVGFDLTTISIIGGALGVGIGFGLQKIASNLISGFLILFDRSIRPGDVISIGESYGWVEKMCARYLVIRDRNGIDTLVPNEEIITSQVINWSYGDRHIRLKIPIQISYGNDPEQALHLMLEALKVNKRILIVPAPAARIIGFGDNGIGLELRVWIDDPERGINNVRSDINLAIWKAFKEHNIVIPYPQRVIHVKT